MRHKHSNNSWLSNLRPETKTNTIAVIALCVPCAAKTVLNIFKPAPEIVDGRRRVHRKGVDPPRAPAPRGTASGGGVGEKREHQERASGRGSSRTRSGAQE